MILRHSQFTTGTGGACNDGTIVGQSLQVTDSCYTSQLNLAVSPTLINTTIECVHDNTAQEVVIGKTEVLNFYLTHLLATISHCLRAACLYLSLSLLFLCFFRAILSGL